MQSAVRIGRDGLRRGLPNESEHLRL
jgi:hypothetical protein